MCFVDGTMAVELRSTYNYSYLLIKLWAPLTKLWTVQLKL